MDQIISIRNLPSDKSQEKSSIKAMNLLEGNEEASLVLPEKKSPSFEVLVHTEHFEQANTVEDDSENQQKELNDILAKVSVSNSLEEKRKLMRDLTGRSISNMAEHSLEVGATFSMEKTYDQIGIEATGYSLWENDEDRVQTLVATRIAVQDLAERVHKKNGRKKVYKGKTELWTPLDKEIPEDQHLRIAEALRDYVEPNHYEQKYQTRKRRQKVIKPLEPEEDYISLPRMTQYVNGGEKMRF